MAPPPQPDNRDSSSPRRPPSPAQLPLHQSDADEEDENVKQLQECSSVYLSLQVQVEDEEHIIMFFVSVRFLSFFPTETIRFLSSSDFAGLSREFQQELEIVSKGSSSSKGLP